MVLTLRWNNKALVWNSIYDHINEQVDAWINEYMDCGMHVLMHE